MQLFNFLQSFNYETCLLKIFSFVYPPCTMPLFLPLCGFVSHHFLLPQGEQRMQQQKCMADLGNSLGERQITFVTNYSETLHDREIRFKNENNVVWVAILGRGLDMYKKVGSWFSLGASDYSYRKCHEVTVTLTRG